MKVSLDVLRPRGVTRTDIECADFSANPIRAIEPEGDVGWACVKVSAGCANCYAEVLNQRFGTGRPFTADGMAGVQLRLDWGTAIRMLRVGRGRLATTACPTGRPKVFVGDMCDLFLGDSADLARGVTGVPSYLIDHVAVLCAIRPDVDWMWLTKRPARAAACFSRWTDDRWRTSAEVIRERLGPHLSASDLAALERPLPWPWANLWLGTSAETQPILNERLDALNRSGAWVRFLSCEPLLSPLAIPSGVLAPHWVIVGGESGPNARLAPLEWFTAFVEHLGALGVAVFVKQLGTRDGYSQKGGVWGEWPAGLRVRRWPLYPVGDQGDTA